MKAGFRGVLTACAIGFAALGGLSGCGESPSDPLPEADATVVLLALDNRFEPVTLSARVGEVVAVVVKNEGFAVHNVRILSTDSEGRDYRSKRTLSPGEESTFKFRFNAPGTYDFQCEFHLPDMSGTIIVE